MPSIASFIGVRLSRKLFVLTLTSTALLGSATIASIWRIHALGQRADQMYADMTAPLHLLGDLEAQFVQVRVSVRDVLLSRSPAESDTTSPR